MFPGDAILCFYCCQVGVLRFLLLGVGKRQQTVANVGEGEISASL